jgi:hypothetical protein
MICNLRFSKICAAERKRLNARKIKERKSLRTFSSHGVARESSPRRKPWVEITPIKAPSGATDISSPEFFFRRYAACDF